MVDQTRNWLWFRGGFSFVHFRLMVLDVNGNLIVCITLILMGKFRRTEIDCDAVKMFLSGQRNSVVEDELKVLGKLGLR